MADTVSIFGDNDAKAKSPSMIDFNCVICGSQFSDHSVTLAVFLYGFVCLQNEDVSYIGITCPSCLGTILIKEDQSPSVLFNWFSSEIDFGPLSLKPQLTYFSSIYHFPLTSQIQSDLRHLNISYFHTSLGNDQFGHMGARLDDHVAMNDLQNHLCSFSTAGNHLPPVDLFTLYVDEQHLNQLLAYEVEKQVQIIPRYRHRLNLIESIELFCAKYGFESAAGRLKDPAKANLENLERIAEEYNLNMEELLLNNDDVLTPEVLDQYLQNESKSEDLDFGRESEFMNILSADPAPWDFPGTNRDWIRAFWHIPYPFKGQKVPTSLHDLKKPHETSVNEGFHKKMVAEIEPLFAKGYVQKRLASLYKSFIREYSRIATRHAFSYADVWYLKELYLEKVYQCIRTKKATRPAFNHKEACRRAAKKRWEQDPDITIADMCVSDDIAHACDGELYDEATLRKWIKDLCPNRKPGRRPKKKKK